MSTEGSDASPAGGLRGRDARLDFFRGVALLAIGLNHCYPPAAVAVARSHYQFGQIFAFNFADVFVFISGLVCGAVYKRVFEREGFATGARKAFRRALSIFVANGAAAALCTVIVLAFAAVGVVDAPHHRLGEGGAFASWLGTTLLYDPMQYFNILNLYVVLLFLLPFLLMAYLGLGRWTLVASAAVWAAVNFVPANDWGSFAWVAARGPFFGAPAAWQFLFFLGVALGVELSRGGLPRVPLAWGSLLALGVLIGDDYFAQARFAIHHFDGKDVAGAARIAELLAVSYLISKAMRPDSRLFELFWARAIVACGRNSLVVFCASLVVAYLTSLCAFALDVGVIGYGVLLAAATGLNLAAANLHIAWLDGTPRARA